MTVDIGLGRQETCGNLFAAHLETEQGGGKSLLRGITRHVERQCALAEAGTCGEYYQVRSLETAAKKLIQAGESGYYRRKRDLRGIVQRTGLLHVVVKVVTDGREALGTASASDAEDNLFRLIQHMLNIRTTVVCKLGYLSARPDDVS